MHMYKVLANRTKVLDEGRRGVTQRVSDVIQKVMTKAMEREHMFQTYFSSPLTGEDVEMKIELADATRYEMRVYLKSFPLPESVQVCGARELSVGIPHAQ